MIVYQTNDSQKFFFLLILQSRSRIVELIKVLKFWFKLVATVSSCALEPTLVAPIVTFTIQP